MHILLTRPLEDCFEMIVKFKSLGHQVSHLPLLSVEVVAHDKITVEAELFSLDGSKRFYEKKTGKTKDFSQIGRELGQILKTKSKNSYKK